MVATTLLLATLSAAGSALAAPAQPTYFHLKTRVLDGLQALDGLYLTSFHVGAGQSAAVVDAYTNVNRAETFYLNQTSLQLYTGSQPGNVPFGLSLPSTKPYNSTAPRAFNYVALDAGMGQSGASLKYDSSAAGYVLSAGSAYAGKLNGPWVVCKVAGVSPYQSVGPQRQVLWKTKGGKTGGDFAGKCADVEFVAVGAPKPA